MGKGAGSAMRLAIILGIAPRLAAADFEYGFRFLDASPCGGVLAAAADADSLTVDVYLTIATRNNEYWSGPSGWAMAMEVSGAAIDAATFAPVVPDSYPAGLDLPVDTIRQDGTISSKVVGLAAWAILIPAASPDPGASGAVTSVILGMPVARGLLPEGTQAVAKISLRIPVGDTPHAVALRYRDDLVLEGSPHPENSVSIGTAYTPVLDECRFDVARASAASFIRGDANDDGEVGIADAIWIVDYLFLAGPEPACVDAADANDDGAACPAGACTGIDISDALIILGYLFRHGAPPPAPFPGCGRDATPDSLACRPTSCR